MSERRRTIAVLGVGMMGGAILRGILARGFSEGADVTVYDVDPAKTKPFVEAYGVCAEESNAAAVRDADVILLAVKPQYISKVMDEISDEIAPEALVVSIAVGVTLSRMTEDLGTSNLVRVMPNMAVQIGKGVSGWIADYGVSQEDKDYVRALLSQVGTAIEVMSEDQIDYFGAISGSGPAFVSLFMEAMMDAGVHLGLSRATSTELVIETVLGSAEYLKEREIHPAILRNEVTSPGGTTAEGLFYLEAGDLRATVAKCIWGSYERTRQIRAHGTDRDRGPSR